MSRARDFLPPAVRRFFSDVKRRVLPVLVWGKRTLINILAALRFFARALPATLGAARGLGASVPRYTATFSQGLDLVRIRARVLAWSLLHHRRIVLVVLHASDDPALEAWLPSAQRLLGLDVLRVPEGSLDPRDLRRELIRVFPRHDALLLDAREPLPTPDDLVHLKYAAHRYAFGKRTGAAVPARLDATGARSLGWDYDRTRRVWRENLVDRVRDYGQEMVPRYVLTDRAHGTYLRREFVSEIHSPAAPADWDDLAARWLAAGWRRNRRTVLYPGAVVRTHLPFAPQDAIAEGWQTERHVIGPDGRIRVIFVLPATTLSGGIRAVLELADGLSKRGLDVAVWALGGRPTWTDVDIDVVQFRTYETLTDALASEHAIKVATWWETGQPVWLSAVNAGIPLHYVQEFETWFYPDTPEGQAAVAAGYRHEFRYVTTAEFQRQELLEIDVEAELIPPAFDSEVFRERPEIARDDDTMLALGRSFFQKNFAMTLAGWRRLGAGRPKLALYGFEPKIASDERLTYHYLPTDEQVAELYNGATCFVQTSLHEGFSLPIIEAMASGCPVITTDSHGNRFCVDGENAIIVEQGDVDGLASAIRRVLDDPQLRDHLRRGGLETASRFTWQTVVAQTADHYTELGRAAESGR